MVVGNIVFKLDLSLEGRQKLVSYNHRLNDPKSRCSSLRLVECDSLSICCALPISRQVRGILMIVGIHHQHQDPRP